MIIKKKYKYYIGIDPGIKTGVAIWNSVESKFELIVTTKIYKAFEIVKTYNNIFPGEVKIRIEDARKRKWFNDGGNFNKKQGAGAIKIQCTQWEEFLEDHSGLEYELIAPKDLVHLTKLEASRFQQLTGYKGQTSSHARDAAMMVFKF